MSQFRVVLPSAFLLAIAALMLACGTVHDPKVQLQSVTISPTAANGQAQFVATGLYSDGSKVTPLPALWFPIRAWYNAANPVNFFNLDETGNASCIQSDGTQTTYAVVATAPVDPKFPLSKMDSLTPQVSGTAQFTCP